MAAISGRISNVNEVRYYVNTLPNRRHYVMSLQPAIIFCYGGELQDGNGGDAGFYYVIWKLFILLPIGCCFPLPRSELQSISPALWAPVGLYIFAMKNVIKCKNYPTLYFFNRYGNENFIVRLRNNKILLYSWEAGVKWNFHYWAPHRLDLMKNRQFQRGTKKFLSYSPMRPQNIQSRLFFCVIEKNT